MPERPVTINRSLTERFRGLPFALRLSLALSLVLLGLGMLRSSAVEWNDVPSPSMRPAVLEGDRIVVSRLAYDVRLPFVGWRVWRHGEPQYGDLVVFIAPDGMRAVKRVIGLPGDRIEVRGHRVVRNGQGLTQASGSTATGAFAGYGLFREGAADSYTVMIGSTAAGAAERASLTVPSGELFLMGDNRSHSRDSREAGTVPRERIVGRAVLVAFSRDTRGNYRRDRILHRLR